VRQFFVLLRLLLALYVVSCVVTGSVVVKWGPGARRFRRDEDPQQFWAGVGVYTLLALALVLVF
jgi:hypothetical protein